MRDKIIDIIWEEYNSYCTDLVVDFQNHLSIDPSRSYLGWLLTLSESKFNRVVDLFHPDYHLPWLSGDYQGVRTESQYADKYEQILLSEVYYEHTEEPKSNGADGISDIQKSMSLGITAIILYKKGLVSIEAKGKDDLWEFKCTEKGEELLDNTN